jgi:hypothetical protein
VTALLYPTPQRLRTRMKGDHGIPADRLGRAYVVQTDGCWRWIKGRTTSGYGHFSMGRVQYQAHRLFYILATGRDVPAGLSLDHLCRNRWCVNPAHLEPVTTRENVRRGSATRLNPALISEIRAAVRAGASQRHVARQIGIDHSTVSRLLAGHCWADVDQKDEAA